MRCRKARSLTSAYSSNELTGRTLTALREHLAICADCRKETAGMQSLLIAAKTLPTPPVSEDFNRILLDRIANERIAETRSKAYFPRRNIVSIWPRMAAAAVTVSAALFAFIFFGADQYGEQPFPSSQSASSVSLGQDDSYLTALPVSNQNLAASLKPGWSLNQQLAHSERIRAISNKLTAPSGFGNMQLAGSFQRSSGYPQVLAPYSRLYFRIRPAGLQYRIIVPKDQSGGTPKEY